MSLKRTLDRGLTDIKASQAGGFGRIEDYFNSQLAADPSYELPGSYEVHNGSVREKPGQGLGSALLKGGLLFGTAMLGGPALINTFGGGAAAGAAGSGVTGASGAGASNMGFGGVGKALGKVFGKNGIDPTALALGTLSALTGGDDGDHRQSFHKGVSSGAAALVDPIQSLYNALAASDRLGVSLSNRLSNGSYLKSSFVPSQGPAPVRIPGLSFQIGGGLGTDPALKDPSLLQNPIGGDLFTSAVPGGSPNMPKGTAPVRRNPR